jgi:hypothetical protein
VGRVEPDERPAVVEPLVEAPPQLADIAGAQRASGVAGQPCE